VLRYATRDLVRNPARTAAALVGITLGVATFGAVLFYDQGSRATLTRRAVAPLALDLQVLLDSPLGHGVRLDERVDAPDPVRPGDEVRFTLTVTNDADTPANDVVVDDEPAEPLRYAAGSLTQDGTAVPDVGGQIPLAQGPAHLGLNLGSVPAGGRTVLAYRATAAQQLARSAVPVQGRLSTREQLVPLRANASAALTVDGLRDRALRVPGVAGADGLWHVDLPPGSVRSGSVVIDRPVRLFAFEPGYQRHYPSIRLVGGRLGGAGAVLSVEAARRLGARPGGTVTVDLPGGTAPLVLPVDGQADLSRARPLFYSRKVKKLEDFLYVPDCLVVSPETFRRAVLPALRRVAAAQGTLARSVAVAEVDVQVDRAGLDSDPAVALRRTNRIAAAVDRSSQGQSELIDNISNTLAVARGDAAVAARMFAFLGLPGIVLAVFLTGYAGGLLAVTHRREHALLRLRGAHAGHLTRLLAAKAVLLAAVGSLAGLLLGLLAVTLSLGRDALAAAGPAALLRTALVALLAGTVTTAATLLLPGIRSLRRDVGIERRELAGGPEPAWRRRRLDLLLVAAAAVAELVAWRTGAFDLPGTLVSEGVSASLPYRLLLGPLLVWLGGVLLLVRLVAWLAGRLPVPGAGTGYGPVVGGSLLRGVRRRPWTLAGGSLGVALVVAFAAALAVFSASYDAAKQADARFTVGSDLRVLPNPLNPEPVGVDAAPSFRVPGVAAVTAVVATPENAVLVAAFNQDRADLVAVDPAGFAATAALADALVPDGTARGQLAALAADPEGVLVGTRAAQELSVGVGDRVQVLLARGTKQQALRPFRVVGVFDRFPGFPTGVDLVVRLDRWRQATGLSAADWFLLRTNGSRPQDLARVEAEVQAGPARSVVVDVETTRTALNKDQSSLTALDIHGLADLDAVFASAAGAAVIAVFVFGLVLHRRREYLTMRAIGLPARALFRLVLAETGLATGLGLLAGLPVGLGSGALLVTAVRPLFVLPPLVVVPAGRVVALALLPVAAALACAGLATLALRRLRPAEILRDA
jgi:putative ABC transport system permease protein